MRLPLNPIDSFIVVARFFMEISLPVPIFIWVFRTSHATDFADFDGLHGLKDTDDADFGGLHGFTSLKSMFSIRKTHASAISSDQRNSRRGLPEPQISTVH